MNIANRLFIPDHIRGILWDMDGVLLDTLGLDLTLCNQLLKKYLGEKARVSKDFIRSIFAYHPPEFWKRILEFIETRHGISWTHDVYETILDEYNIIRNDSAFEVNPGIEAILGDCAGKGIQLAVVSNNPTEDVKKILSQSGIAQYFQLIVGNDLADLKKKPAPDTYLYAARTLGLNPKACVVVEDSELGAEAGHRAGCLTVAVATGGTVFEVLENSPWPHRVYTAFDPVQLTLTPGDVTDKSLKTPNDFVSHMIEHIAWRLGCGIKLFWNSNDWQALGLMLGSRIREMVTPSGSTAALGMIDDGSGEVAIHMGEDPEVCLETASQVDRDWFLSLRCEQIPSAAPLMDLLQGITRGLPAKFGILVCSLEDPHHTWEGIFRAIGIALNRLSMSKPELVRLSTIDSPTVYKSGGLEIRHLTVNSATVIRKTAESHVRVSVNFQSQGPNAYVFDVAPSIDVSGVQEILDLMANQAGFGIQVAYQATLLNSSHVVLEDTGLVLGRALKEILIQRMHTYGVNGAGSSVKTPEDKISQPISVGVSVEGRKFWKIVPLTMSSSELKRKFIIGHTLTNGLFTEDLDDFIDGLAGGLAGSILIHVKQSVAPDKGWRETFYHLGTALKEAFSTNPCRKGVPPGVKATMD